MQYLRLSVKAYFYFILVVFRRRQQLTRDFKPHVNLVEKESKLVFLSAGRGLCFYNYFFQWNIGMFTACSPFKFAD